MLEPKNSNVAILNAIERSLINAARNFELAANGLAGTMDWAAYRMPEYCIVSMLMQDLQQMGVAAFPEVRISHDLEEAVKGIISGGQKMSSARYPLLKGCKIDLFAFDYSGAEGSPVLRAALEVKGPKSSFRDFPGDIERLGRLAEGRGDDQQFIFAYATAPLTDKEAAREELAVRMALQSGSSKDWQFKTLRGVGDGMQWGKDRSGYVFIAHR